MTHANLRAAVPRLALSLILCLGLSACNRAALRVPGASLGFPATATGFVAKAPSAASVQVARPVDLRSAHYSDPVAGSSWEGCRTDALWLDSAPGLLQERLSQELAASRLFGGGVAAAGAPGAPGTLVLKSEIHAFCSQAVGFLVLRVAGITAVKFTLERDGQVVWQKKIERVVTDADPEYTGSQAGFIEQAMRVTMADSLRLALGDTMKALDQAPVR